MNVISEDKMNSVIDSINSLRKDIELWKDEVKSEIEFLGTICWNVDDQLKKLMQTKPTRTTSNLTIHHPPVSTSSKFPLQTTENLHAFEQEITDADAFQRYLQYFTDQLQTIRQAKSVYSRRLHLKECLLSE